jgi:hypothetical protein
MKTLKALKVIKLIKLTDIESDYVSPNFVADIAYSNKVKLTSDEIVYISDNYDMLLDKLNNIADNLSDLSTEL